MQRGNSEQLPFEFSGEPFIPMVLHVRATPWPFTYVYCKLRWNFEYQNLQSAPQTDEFGARVDLP